jgi:hypothetical protein
VVAHIAAMKKSPFDAQQHTIPARRIFQPQCVHLVPAGRNERHVFALFKRIGVVHITPNAKSMTSYPGARGKLSKHSWKRFTLIMIADDQPVLASESRLRPRK